MQPRKSVHWRPHYLSSAGHFEPVFIVCSLFLTVPLQCGHVGGAVYQPSAESRLALVIEISQRVLQANR